MVHIVEDDQALMYMLDEWMEMMLLVQFNVVDRVDSISLMDLGCMAMDFDNNNIKI